MKKSVMSGLLSGVMMFSGGIALAAGEVRTSDGQLVHWRGAEPLENRAANYPEEWQGAGVGAIAGAIVGGPAGLVVGLTSGALFGRQAGVESELMAVRSKVEGLEQSLIKAKQGLDQSEQQQQSLKRALVLAKEQIKQQLNHFAQSFVLTVSFRTEGAQIEHQYTSQLYQVAQLVKQIPTLKLHLNAYTDARGSKSYNEKLAQRRAESVSSYLQRLGVDSGRINLESHGEDQSEYPETDIEGTGFDRHVLITFCVKEVS